MDPVLTAKIVELTGLVTAQAAKITTYQNEAAAAKTLMDGQTVKIAALTAELANANATPDVLAALAPVEAAVTANNTGLDTENTALGTAVTANTPTS